ncbi:hypothetical protein FEM48_Zijuj09G0157900 [Ziziphus jujuba var. spinosa]|uniref:NAC domain-containing protein n=1 Tax=Ziziphus jujuba var. spinosa TaxID=714518 RepID=A0A978UTW1_ZIZJJ|nr:hypothetical protein FEM48_Zijuj09G0157900 [Ziziphus jujuba var. spinosa]
MAAASSASNSMDEMTPELDLPGFRFHPTEEELLDFYLKNMVMGSRLRFDIIGMAKIGEREWYFFVPRDRKHGSGGRPNRTTEKGFWKATGSDRRIVSLSEPKRIIGLRKTLVFYKGRAPRGSKTDWVMNEYRLPDNCQMLKDIVLCKVYRKATSLKVLEQRAAMEEEMKNFHASPASTPSPLTETFSFCGTMEADPTPPLPLPMPSHQMVLKKEAEEEVALVEDEKVEKEMDQLKGSSQTLQLPLGKNKLPEIQVPKMTMDWNQDPFWTQLSSPWLQNLTPYANILNF